MTSEKTVRGFDREDTLAVKGVAIILLCYYHLFHDQGVTELFNVSFLLPKGATQMLTGFGNICVAVFLFLSAYGITKKLTASDNILKKDYLYSIKRYITLTVNFFLMYVSVNLLWFSKFDYTVTYGQGKQGFVFAVADALGIGHFFNIPTICETWWYMELAIVCIFAVPLILRLNRKIGWLSLILAFLIPSVFSMEFDLFRYYMVIFLGVTAANEDWLKRIHTCRVPKWSRIVITLLLIVLSVFIRQNYMVYETFAYLLDAPIALLLSYAVYEVIPGKSIPGRVLGFLGKHSMNIYFVHSFFYMILYRDYCYAPKRAILILPLLLMVSLAYSLILEGIKKIIQIPRLITWIDGKIGKV